MTQQNADAALQQATQDRQQQAETELAQQSGQIKEQTKDLKPSAQNPDEGIPATESGDNHGGSGGH